MITAIALVAALWLAAFWAMAHDVTPPPRDRRRCPDPKCGKLGRATLGPGSDSALLWTCPGCGAHWLSTEGGLA